MKLADTPIAGLHLVDTEPVGDARGRFERLFCERDWSPLRDNLRFVQVNLSTTASLGAIRGLHYQRPPVAEAKLIRCVRGAVFDVAVDLRADSPTFLRWHAVELDEHTPREVFIPEGFAHGFQALTDDAQLLYFHTAPWTPDAEGGLRHDDSALAIKWPMPASSVSQRDSNHPLLAPGFEGMRL